MSRFSPETAISRIESTKANTKFVGWHGNYTNTKNSYVVVECTIHNHQFILRVECAIKKDVSCEYCKIEKNGKRAQGVRNVPHHIENFKKTGKFVEGTEFKRNYTLSTPKNTLWDVYCPVCAVDKYSLAGLCTGWFVGGQAHLKLGNLPCRCSKKPSFTDAQWLYRIEEASAKLNLRLLELIKPDSVPWSLVKAKLTCGKHPEFYRDVPSILRQDNKCPHCGHYGFNTSEPSFIYVLYAESILGDFTGYGITNNVSRRLSEHRKALSSEGFRIKSYEEFSVSGSCARDIERLIGNKFPKYPQKVDGFRWEATLPELYHDLIVFMHEESTLFYPPCPDSNALISLKLSPDSVHC